MGMLSDKKVSIWFLGLSESLAAGFDALEAIGLSRGIPEAMCNALTARIGAGSNWSDALDESCGFLENGERSILAAAERAGSLPEAFKALGESRRESAHFKNRAKLAAIYPIGLLHLAAFIFPTDYLWAGQYEAYGVSVGLILIPLWCVGVAMAALFKAAPAFKKWVQLRLPLIRAFTLNLDLGRFCQVFAACLRSGLPIDACWENALDAANSRRLLKPGEAAIRAIRSGAPANEAIARFKGVPEELQQLYAIGERMGDLDENLDRGAEMYLGRARTSLSIATLAYPAALFGIIALFVAVKVVLFYKGYFDGVVEMME